MTRLLAATLAACVCFSVPLAASAQPGKKISAKARREAKRLFNQAHLAYRRGDYEEAILKWEQSYELSREPLIYLSIANAYERLGDSQRTREYLRQWREKAPRREHKELDSRIERLDARIAEEQEAEARKLAAAEKRRKKDEQQRQKELDSARQQEDANASASSAETWQIVGWSAIGTSAAAIITGVILDGVAAAKRPAQDEACADADGQLLCLQDQRDDIETSNTLAIAGDITWIAGAAIGAAGVVVLFTLASDDDNDGGTARVVPIVSPTTGGVVLTTRF